MTKEESKKPKSKTRGEPGTREPKPRTGHKKVFDVLPPGKAVASPNSRSVIVGHKPPVKDDQFVPGPSEVAKAPGTSSSSMVASGAASDSVSSSAFDAAAHDVGTKSTTAKSAAHTRMAGDPSEKRPLLDSHKKLELKPVAEANDAKKNVAKPSEPSGDTVAEPKAAPVPAPVTGRLSEAAARVGSSAEADHPAEPQGAPELTGKTTAMADVNEVDQSDQAPLVAGTPVSESDQGQAATLRFAQPAQPNSYENAPEHLADLAVEQTVETETFDQSGQEQGGQGNAIKQRGNRDADAGGIGNGTAPGKHQTVDDILAETGPPDLTPQKAVVSTHHHRAGALQVILIFLLVLILAVVVLNFLLDAEIIETGLDLPHTDLIR